MAREDHIVILDVKKVGIYALCLVTAVVAGGLLKFLPSAVVEGIDCFDSSIYKANVAETIPSVPMVYYTCSFVAGVVLLTETILHCCNRQRRKPTPRYKFGPIEINSFFYNFCRCYFGFIYSYACNFAICCLMKSFYGKLRPCFMAVCNPDLATLGCNETHRFIDSYHCRAAPDEIKDACESCPSRHAAASFGAALYLSVYFHRKIRHPLLHHVRALFMVALFMVAILVTVQKVYEHAHHAVDSIVGVVIGVVFAVYSLHYTVGWFKEAEYSSNTSENETGHLLNGVLCRTEDGEYEEH